jgi:hypothetical protein
MDYIGEMYLRSDTYGSAPILFSSNEKINHTGAVSELQGWMRGRASIVL